MAVGVADASAQIASYYGEELKGSPVACTGQPYDPDGLTAAHKTLPCGTRLLVRHEGRGVAVTITDRGPYTHGRDLDLSAAAARVLGIDGVEAVSVEQVDNPTPTIEAPTLPTTGGIGG